MRESNPRECITLPDRFTVCPRPLLAYRTFNEIVSVSVFSRCRLLPWVSRSYASRRRLHGAARGSRTHSLLLTKQLHNHCAIAAVWHRPWFHYFKKIILSRSMPDGTLAHLRLAEREGFDPPCPFGLRFSRPTHLPILPPLHSAGLSLLVTFAKVGTCRSQRSARLNGLPVWTRTRNSRINSAVHYHCATGK